MSGPLTAAPVVPAADRAGMVSVVIPTYDRPEQLLAAVRSVLAQTRSDLEVIVVHDGPDVRSVRPVEDLDDPRVRVVRTPSPSGDAGATARNLGIREATGRWVALLDDDDEWAPTKLQDQLDLLDRLSATDAARTVVSGRIERRTPEGTVLWPVRLIGDGERIGDYLFVRSVAGEGWLHTSTLLVPVELARRVSFRTGLIQHEDYDWLLGLEAVGARFTVVDRRVAVQHVHMQAGSMSSRASWSNSLAWARSRRAELGDVAFSAFCLNDVARHAKREASVRAFVDITAAALTARPRSRDLARYLARWAVPTGLTAHVTRLRLRGSTMARPSTRADA